MHKRLLSLMLHDCLKLSSMQVKDSITLKTLKFKELFCNSLQMSNKYNLLLH